MAKKLTSIGSNSPMSVHGITRTPMELQQTYPRTHISKMESLLKVVCSKYMQIAAKNVQNAMPKPDDSKNVRRPICLESLFHRIQNGIQHKINELKPITKYLSQLLQKKIQFQLLTQHTKLT